MADQTNPEGSRGPISPWEAGKEMASLFKPTEEPPELEGEAETEAVQEKAQDVEAVEEPEGQAEADDATEQQDMSDGEEAEPEGEDTSDEAFRLELTVNGEQRVIDDPDEARSLAQKGMHYTQEMQALREEQRKWEGDREEITASLEAKETQYDSALSTLEQTFGAVLGEIDMTSPEIQELKQSDPQQYLQLREQMDQLEAIKAERQRIARERQEKQQEQFQEWVQSQKEELETKKPEWNDPGRRQKDFDAIREYAYSRGLTDQELSNLYDHRFLLVLHDAARYQQAQDTGKTKVKEAAESKTVAPKNGKKLNSKGRQARKRRERLAETGDVNVAGDLLQELMTSKR